jgi:hypothetical protein
MQSIDVWRHDAFVASIISRYLKSTPIDFGIFDILLCIRRFRVHSRDFGHGGCRHDEEPVLNGSAPIGVPVAPAAWPTQRPRSSALHGTRGSAARVQAPPDDRHAARYRSATD